MYASEITLLLYSAQYLSFVTLYLNDMYALYIYKVVPNATHLLEAKLTDVT